MAWLTGSFPDTAVGRMIAVLDAQLVGNAHWTVHDAAAGISPGDLMLNGNFATNDYTSWTAGANWSAATGKSKRTPAVATTVTQTKTLKIGYYYDAVIVVSLRTAGTLTVSMTNTTGGPLAIVADGTYTIRFLATSTSCVLTFTPDANFDGAFDDVTLNQVLTNCKVYKCTDGVVNCTFYLKVDDEHIGFSVLELWEGWDAGTHVGTGVGRTVSSGLIPFRWNRPTGGWNISLHDHWFILTNADYAGYWCGRPTLYDVTKNIVMIACAGTTGTVYNNLAYYSGGGGGGWAFLFDENGSQTDAVGGQGGAASYGTNRYWKGIDGRYHVTEELIVNTTSTLVVGVLTGVVNAGDLAGGLINGDLITISGVDWVAIGNSGASHFWSLVRKD